MHNLFLVIDSLFSYFPFTLVDFFSVLAVLFGILVINSKNPIVSILYLIALFSVISVNLLLLGANFLGLSYLLVYVGAVSILFIFILMLINVRISELLDDTSKSIPLAILAGLSLGSIFYLVLDFGLQKEKIARALAPRIDLYSSEPELFKNVMIQEMKKSRVRGEIDLTQKREIFNSNGEVIGVVEWDTNLADFTDITSVGCHLYSTYSIWLMICSMILLLAMIGAISITKKD